MTVAFTGSRPGHAVTDGTGTAVFTVHAGYDTTAGSAVESESAAAGSCSAGPVTFLLPGTPAG